MIVANSLYQRIFMALLSAKDANWLRGVNEVVAEKLALV